MIQIDDTDRLILNEIQKNSRISNNELARRIHLSQPAAHGRLKRLKKQGIIRNYSVQMDYEKLGFDMICFFHTRLLGHLEENVAEFESCVSKFPEVLECHYVTGDFDHLIKAIFKNRRELEHFLRNKLSTIPGVSKITTSLVLSEVKTDQILHLSDKANKQGDHQ